MLGTRWARTLGGALVSMACILTPRVMHWLDTGVYPVSGGPNEWNFAMGFTLMGFAALLVSGVLMLWGSAEVLGWLGFYAILAFSLVPRMFEGPTDTMWTLIPGHLPLPAIALGTLGAAAIGYLLGRTAGRQDPIRASPDPQRT